MSHTKDNYIDSWVTRLLIDENEQEMNSHVSSGKLTASMLGQPLQWQLLKVKGVPAKEFDPYLLRKFQRGKDVEKWLVSRIPGKKSEQEAVVYQDVVGFADVVVSTRNYNFDAGTMPEEVKSVTNMKFKNIQKSGTADRGHILQACLYAMALESNHFGIIYIASDDYRILNYVYKTADYRDEVQRIINRFKDQRDTGIVPTFTPEEPWQKNKEYNLYPDWADLTQEEINLKLKDYEPKESQTA